MRCERVSKPIGVQCTDEYLEKRSNYSACPTKGKQGSTAPSDSSDFGTHGDLLCLEPRCLSMQTEGCPSSIVKSRHLLDSLEWKHTQYITFLDFDLHRPCNHRNPIHRSPRLRNRFDPCQSAPLR